jgi:hypothetical protein
MVTRAATIVSGGNSFTATPTKKNEPPQTSESRSSKPHSLEVIGRCWTLDIWERLIHGKVDVRPIATDVDRKISRIRREIMNGARRAHPQGASGNHAFARTVANLLRRPTMKGGEPSLREYGETAAVTRFLLRGESSSAIRELVRYGRRCERLRRVI